MVISFLTMYNKNQFFYKTHENKRNKNLNNVVPQHKCKKTSLMFKESLWKKWSWTDNLWLMIIVDTAALLTREVYVKQVASKLRFCHCTLGHLTHSTRRGLNS